MTAGFGLLLDRLRSMGAPLFLSAVLPIPEKKRVFGWARVWLGAQRGRLQVPAVHAGGKVDISCSNVKKNGGEQWASHAKTHHSALLAKQVARAAASTIPPAS